MNRQIRWLGVAIMALFVALFVQLNYLQVVHASSLNHNALNGHTIVKEYDQPRGDIVSSDGVVLARSVPSDDQFTYLREYPTGALFGQVTGYFSFTYGASGVEEAYDSTLTGASAKVQVPTNLSSLKNLLTNGNKTQDVTLTLSDKLQTVAEQQLAGRDGSVVALNPKTGAILAMYSNPSYDPSLLSGHDQQTVMSNWATLNAASGQPLLNGSYRQRWFPGSTFKMITASAVYDHDPSLATKSYPVTSGLTLPDTSNILHNFADESCGGQLLSLFTVSCDTGFGQIGLDLGATNLADEASAFGFDQTPPIDLPGAAQSSFPSAASFAQNQPGLAYSAIGQEDVQATPLEMAMVAGAFADGGTIMTPHVLAKVTNSQGQVVATYQPKKWLQATSASTSQQMTTLMESVVNSSNGTGTAARITGVEVAAKTGTAQTGTGEIDAWFAAFAPNPDPSIAVAVVLPNQPSANEYQGGTLAAPIAKAMIEAYLAGSTTTPTTTSGTNT